MHPNPYGQSDPYWQSNPYGIPPPATGRTRATGKALLSASWRMLRQDRELLWLPALGTLASLLAAGIFFVPGWFLGASVSRTGHYSTPGIVGGAVGAAAATIIGIYFQAALVIGAYVRAEGGDPNVRSCLRAAWALRGPILKWGLLSATVGVVIRAVERRLGFLGSLLGFLGGLTWAIASFLVVPVLVAENLGPIASVKRSAQLIKASWGTSLRTTLRFGFLQVVVTIVPLFAAIFGIAAIVTGSTTAIAIGVPVVVVSVAVFLAATMVFAAIGSYARALIYRYASGQPVPGIEPTLFAGAFAPRRRVRDWGS